MRRASLVTLTIAFLGAPESGAFAQQASEVARPGQDAVVRSPADEVEVLAAILRELRGLREDLRRLKQEPPSQKLERAVPPPPTPSSVKLSRGPFLGSELAPVAIIEFSDFQCPFCKRHYDGTLPRIKSSYLDTGKVRYEFRDFPLTAIHPQARSAAIAGRCAAQQNAYPEMRAALFRSQEQLAPDLYLKLARSQDLDTTVFARCLADPGIASALDADASAAGSIGVRGAPHFVVGRVHEDSVVDLTVLRGAQPFDTFQQLIDGLLGQRTTPDSATQ
jgi:protein-disulfide isomerase